MPESVLTILKFCFLALLYLFLFRVVRVVVKEMRAPAPVPEQPAAPPSAAPVSASSPAKPAKGRGPGRLKILEPPARQGESFPLTEELTVGRGGGCGIVLADDSFVSTVHAVCSGATAWSTWKTSARATARCSTANRSCTWHSSGAGHHVQFGQTVAEAVR